MMKTTAATVILLVLFTEQVAGIGAEFGRFPSEPALEGQPVTPIVASGKARRYRTVLRAAAAQGPNFNGHYRVTHWGCGTNCIEWAVINLQNGRVWIAPEPAISCWAPDQEQDAKLSEWYEVHLDSALMYVHQCTRSTRAAFDTRVGYVWTGARMQPLRSVRLEH